MDKSLKKTFNFENLLFSSILLTITIVGCIFRYHFIDYHSLWFDEGYTIIGAISNIFPFKNFLDGSTAKNAYPPLEFILHHFILKYYGISDLTARIVPCFFGIMAIPLIGFLGKKTASPFVGVCAALFIAFSPLNVYLSSEARYYSHIIFAVIVYTYFVTCFLEKQNIFRTILLFFSIIYIFNVSLLFLFAVPFIVIAVAIYDICKVKFIKLFFIHFISSFLKSIVFIYTFY